MFVLKNEIKAFWPVKVKEPDPKSAGRFIQYSFDVEITLLDRDQVKARDDARNDILNGTGEAKDIVEELNAFDDQSFIDLISDWRGVVDEDKREVPFSSDVLVRALKQPHIRAGFQHAYEEMATGEIRKKN